MSKNWCCNNISHPNDWFCKNVYMRQKCAIRPRTPGITVTVGGGGGGGGGQMPAEDILKLGLSFHHDVDHVNFEQILIRMTNDPYYQLTDDLAKIPAVDFVDNRAALSTLVQEIEPFLYSLGPYQPDRFRSNLAGLSDVATASEFLLDVPYQGSLALKSLTDEINNASEEPSDHRLRALLALLEDEGFEEDATAVHNYIARTTLSRIR